VRLLVYSLKNVKRLKFLMPFSFHLHTHKKGFSFPCSKQNL
jgi:hypothetical protein